MCFAPQRRALFRHLNLQKWSDHGVLCTCWLRNVLRHNGVHFFDIATSKSGPTMVCFVHFDLEMCFALQRRALFRHRNFQKWSGAEVFCTFWLGNVLRATTACTFSTSQLPKVLRDPGALYILTWKCASRHNGVQFFISHLASWLHTRPPEPQIIGKAQCFATFLPFSRICIFFLLALSLLSASSRLCFSSVHIVGSLTSKLPSTSSCSTAAHIIYPLTIIYVATEQSAVYAGCFPRKTSIRKSKKYHVSYHRGVGTCDTFPHLEWFK